MSEQPIVRRRVVNSGISEARANDGKTQSQYQPHKNAAWGLINHWYPALFSHELAEDQVEGIQICGIAARPAAGGRLHRPAGSRGQSQGHAAMAGYRPVDTADGNRPAYKVRKIQEG